MTTQREVAPALRAFSTQDAFSFNIKPDHSSGP
jgi:hypothetical protein